ncbi:hypothetical protein DXG01_010702 [Tephrocybe rancida]|nr:hypothetical protein DXG01_010702 [Tephrocybe rancida]
MLQASPNALHLCVDGWTLPQVISFLGVTVTWASRTGMKSIILDFIWASAAHTGVYLAEQLSKCLQEYGINRKVMGLVLDNASNNGMLMDKLEVLVPSFRGKELCVCCFAHILNLVVKAVLLQFTKKKKSPDDPDHDSSNSDDIDEFELLLDVDDAIADDLKAVCQHEDKDEVVPSVAASDAAMVDAIVATATYNEHLPHLSVDDIKLGQFSIFKSQ